MGLLRDWTSWRRERKSGDEARTSGLSARERAEVTHTQGKFQENRRCHYQPVEGVIYIVLTLMKASGALSSDSTAMR